MSNLHKRAGANRSAAALHVNPLYSGLISEGGVPRYRLPDGPMHPDAALAIMLGTEGGAHAELRPCVDVDYSTETVHRFFADDVRRLAEKYVETIAGRGEAELKPSQAPR
ncbi:hypothetical protein [Nonomuraea sp. NPDC003754]